MRKPGGKRRQRQCGAKAGELDFQFLPCTCQPARERSFRDAQSGGRLGTRSPLQIAEQDRPAIAFGQSGNGRIEQRQPIHRFG